MTGQSAGNTINAYNQGDTFGVVLNGTFTILGTVGTVSSVKPTAGVFSRGRSAPTQGSLPQLNAGEQVGETFDSQVLESILNRFERIGGTTVRGEEAARIVRSQGAKALYFPAEGGPGTLTIPPGATAWLRLPKNYCIIGSIGGVASQPAVLKRIRCFVSKLKLKHKIRCSMSSDHVGGGRRRNWMKFVVPVRSGCGRWEAAGGGQ